MSGTNPELAIIETYAIKAASAFPRLLHTEYIDLQADNLANWPRTRCGGPLKSIEYCGLKVGANST